MIKYYIENLGPQTLGDEIMRMAENDPRIAEHPGMECLDRRGARIVRNLYEVPKEVADRVVRMAKTAGFMYNRYKQAVGKLPQEDLSQFVPIVADPFKEARGKRRKASRALPKGVIRGSALLESRFPAPRRVVAKA